MAQRLAKSVLILPDVHQRLREMTPKYKITMFALLNEMVVYAMDKYDEAWEADAAAAREQKARAAEAAARRAAAEPDPDPYAD